MDRDIEITRMKDEGTKAIYAIKLGIVGSISHRYIMQKLLSAYARALMKRNAARTSLY
jgi:hypothetical protein